MHMIIAFHILSNLEGVPFLAATSTTALLISSAFTFKLAFTAADSPELVIGFAKAINDKFEGQSLIWRARIIFVSLGALSVFTIFRGLSSGRCSRSAGKLTPRALHPLSSIATY